MTNIFENFAPLPHHFAIMNTTVRSVSVKKSLHTSNSILKLLEITHGKSDNWQDVWLKF